VLEKNSAPAHPLVWACLPLLGGDGNLITSWKISVEAKQRDQLSIQVNDNTPVEHTQSAIPRTPTMKGIPS